MVNAGVCNSLITPELSVEGKRLNELKLGVTQQGRLGEGLLGRPKN